MYGKRRLNLVAPLFVKVVVASLVMKLGWACGGGGGGGGGGGVGENKDGGQVSAKVAEEIKKKTAGSWGGFDIPPDVVEKWANWLEKFKADQKLLKEMNKDGTAVDDTDGPGSSWPSDWKGAGVGHEGFPPMEIPPWGYKVRNTGLPRFCYLTPDRGRCATLYTKENLQTRWAFNPYLEECSEFEYVGCLGNQNNFVEKLNCENACINPDQGGCDPETDFPVGGDDIFIEDNVSPELKNLKRRCGHEPNV